MSNDILKKKVDILLDQVSFDDLSLFDGQIGIVDVETGVTSFFTPEQIKEKLQTFMHMDIEDNPTQTFEKTLLDAMDIIDVWSRHITTPERHQQENLQRVLDVLKHTLFDECSRMIHEKEVREQVGPETEAPIIPLRKK